MRTRFGMGTAAAATLLAVLASAPPAFADGDFQAAATCYAASCGGKSPETTGCSSDAFTAKSSLRSDGILLELRYSPTCRAAWGRISHAYRGVAVTVRNSTQQYNTRSVQNGATSAFSYMENDAGLVAWACTEYLSPKTCTGNY